MANYRITEIDWASLKDANGYCENYPSLFESIQSKDQAVRTKAYWQLENHAIVQGTLYEAAPFVCDVLIGFLHADQECFCKLEVYNFLVEAAYGDGISNVESTYLDATLSLKEACNVAIRNGVDAFVLDLNDGNQKVRVCAADLLLAIPEALCGRDGLIEKINSSVKNSSDERLLKTLKELLSNIPSIC